LRAQELVLRTVQMLLTDFSTDIDLYIPKWPRMTATSSRRGERCESLRALSVPDFAAPRS
jgi:hypothetical protein